MKKMKKTDGADRFMDHLLCLLIYLMSDTARFSKRLAEMGIGQYEEWAPGRKLKILLVGYNGARNTGSDVRAAAIAKQIIEILGKEKAHAEAVLCALVEEISFD